LLATTLPRKARRFWVATSRGVYVGTFDRQPELSRDLGIVGTLTPWVDVRGLTLLSAQLVDNPSPTLTVRLAVLFLQQDGEGRRRHQGVSSRARACGRRHRAPGRRPITRL
jgi:hypothetical protein